MTSKIIVVFGSTGVQGSSFIKYLSQQNTSPSSPVYTIKALTRDSSSGSAKRLASFPGVQVCQVDANNQDAPAKAFSDLGLRKGDVYGVFSVQGYVDDKTMEAQGNSIADVSHALGVKHIVYSSGDFGDLNDCGVVGFEVKRKVENHIKTLSGLGYTFLKPVQFMENYSPNQPFPIRIGQTVVLKYTFKKNSGKKHQLISGRDIGKAGAIAIVEGPHWCDGYVRLAGDELTVEEIQELYKEVIGTPYPVVFGPLVRLMTWIVPIIGQMRSFYNDHGNQVPIAQVRASIPEMEGYRAFLLRWKAEHP